MTGPSDPTPAVVVAVDQRGKGDEIDPTLCDGVGREDSACGSRSHNAQQLLLVYTEGRVTGSSPHSVPAKSGSSSCADPSKPRPNVSI